MEHKIIVVGIGPGSPDYIVPAATRAITAAKIIVGSKRALDTFAAAAAETRIIDSDIDGILDYIETKLKADSVVVLVSGDPGFYSMLSALRRRFSPERLDVIPGIGSTQMAFARISEPWQDACLISMHGRMAADAEFAYAPGKRLGILTDHKNQPASIAKLLLAAGWPEDSRAWLCTRLSYPDEQIFSGTLKEAAAQSGFTHSVMVVME